MTTEKQPAEATPRPWSVYEDAEYVAVMLPDPDDYIPIGTPSAQTRADAALIVAAVNDYDRLLRVEAAARDVCRGWFDEIKDDQDMRALLLALRAALDPTAAGEGR